MSRSHSATIWCVFFGVASAIAAAQSRSASPDLVGRITDPDGKSLANANAYVWTARPRHGTSSY